MYAYRVMGLLHASASCAVEDSTKFNGVTIQTIPVGKAILMAFDHKIDLCQCVTQGR
jgi:hypothetical protein